MTGQHIYLHVSIKIAVRHYFHIRNNDSDGPSQFPNSNSDQGENSEKSHYGIASKLLEFLSADLDQPLHEGQLNWSPLSCMPTSSGTQQPNCCLVSNPFDWFYNGNLYHSQSILNEIQKFFFPRRICINGIYLNISELSPFLLIGQ